jgi:hypothetical protein
MLRLGEPGNELFGVAQGDQLATIGQNDDVQSGATSPSLRSMAPTLLVDTESEPRRQSRWLGGVADWTGLTGGAAVACARS